MLKLTLDDPIPKKYSRIVYHGDTVRVYFDDDQETIDYNKNLQDIKNKEIRQEKKTKRLIDIGNTIITTQADNSFDGNEESQNRMMRTIMTMAEPVEWVLADNSVIVVTKAELQEALTLAVEAQGSQWVI